MNNSLQGTQALTWRSYQLIRKKAMDQERSLAGLVISLSIAFFLVITSSMVVNSFISSWENKETIQENRRENLVESRSLVLNIQETKSLEFFYLNNKKDTVS